MPDRRLEARPHEDGANGPPGRTEPPDASKEQRHPNDAAQPERRAPDPHQILHQATHDLQEPLRIIEGFAHVILDRHANELSDEVRDYLGEVRTATARMQRLVASILELGRGHDQPPQIAPTDLDAVVREAWENVQASALESAAKLDADPLPAILADRDRLVRVFQNLFSNAIKFAKPNEPPRIRLGLNKHADRLDIEVTDNGQGMDAERAPSIFEPFTRLHGGEVPGSGVGLAIVRQAIEAHQGTVDVRSAEGEGTTIRLSFPARLVVEHEPVANTTDAHPTPDPEPSTKWRIVLTDDVPALRRLTKLHLALDGRFEVVGEAGDGIEALEVITNTQPDLVLLDLSMPNMDGLEVLAALRAKNLVTKVIVLSAFTASKMADTALKLGAHGYLEKGLSPTSLSKELADLMAPATR